MNVVPRGPPTSEFQQDRATFRSAILSGVQWKLEADDAQVEPMRGQLRTFEGRDHDAHSTRPRAERCSQESRQSPIGLNDGDRVGPAAKEFSGGDPRPRSDLKHRRAGMKTTTFGEDLIDSGLGIRVGLGRTPPHLARRRFPASFGCYSVTPRSHPPPAIRPRLQSRIPRGRRTERPAPPPGRQSVARLGTGLLVIPFDLPFGNSASSSRRKLPTGLSRDSFRRFRRADGAPSRSTEYDCPGVGGPGNPRIPRWLPTVSECQWLGGERRTAWRDQNHPSLDSDRSS